MLHSTAPATTSVYGSTILTSLTSHHRPRVNPLSELSSFASHRFAVESGLHSHVFGRTAHAIQFQAVANSQMASPYTSHNALCLRFSLFIVIYRSSDGLYLIGRWFICAILLPFWWYVASHSEFD